MLHLKIMVRRLKLIALCAALMLAACGTRNDNASNDNASNDQADTGADITLPKPEGAGGSVTGMPDKPGPRPVGPQTGTTPDQTLPVDAEVAGDGTVAAPPDAAGASSPGHGEAAPAEPTPEDAVEVVRDYYSSIDAQNYAHAFALWADGGHASEQTPQQFADGFANTAHVALETGEPGTIEGAAGSRFIQVPVSIDATLRDGSSLEYTGIYTLRRAMVDGANADQRAWRIASASIREVKQ